MMFREFKCDECGGKILEPYSSDEYRTPYERMDFEREWDRRVAAGKKS